MKSYKVKEMFLSLQGEGFHAGRPAVFVRFAGCNLWSGREEDRSSAVCQFCDTDFLGGERLTGIDIVGRAAGLWGQGRQHRFVVFTGGEPTLQADYALVELFHRHDFEVAVETNGTREIVPLYDWVTVSPKAGTTIVATTGSELKFVFPQKNIDPSEFRDGFDHFYIQPMDGPDREANTASAIQYCLNHPRWRLSLQIHKLLGIR
jgi:7-carboxy-7-deazaguanine synthase (Cx14CxxC type)